MANYNLRILLETVEGVKTSYIAVSGSTSNAKLSGPPAEPPITASFINTSEELVLSSSQAYNRITGSVSCSYQNQTNFNGSFNTGSNLTFKNNNLLSASLSGSVNFGIIEFIATDTQYDRLKRYKFFGDKVCNTLGLTPNQWIYVDQARFPADDELNYFEGNVNAKTLHVTDNLSFSPASNITSHLTFFNDTGSDKFIRFVDERTHSNTPIQKMGMFMGYNESKDQYEIGSDITSNVNHPYKGLFLRGINEISSSTVADTINFRTDGIVLESGIASGDQSILFTQAGDTSKRLQLKMLTTGAGELRVTAEDQDFNIRTSDFNYALYIDDSTERVGIGENSPESKLHVDGDVKATNITASGDISSSGTITMLTASIGGGIFTSASLAAGGGGGSSTNAAGSDTQVQFNDGGTNFGGDAGLVYNKSTDTLTAVNISATTFNTTHFTSSFITSSTIVTEGSNTFGDTTSDTHTFNGDIILTADSKLKSSETATNNFLEFDDDAGSPTNQTILSSVSSIGLIIDGNGNGTGEFKIFKDGTDSTATQLFRIENDGDAVLTGGVTATNITASGDISASLTSTASFGRVEAITTLTAEHLESTDDAFITDNITIGGEILLGSSQDHAIGINQPGGNTAGRKLAISASNANIATSGNFKGGNVELQGGGGVGSADDGYVILNGGRGNVGIRTYNPTKELQVTGDISASGTIFATAVGGDLPSVISGSSTALSSSISDRVKTLEGNFVATAASISGSSTALSSSIAEDITEFKDGTITLISGSSTSTGSFGHLMVGGGNFTSASLAADNGAVSAVANGSNNRVATFSSADALNGEANLLFDGSILEIGGKLKVSSHITASKNISGSAISTGSFGAGFFDNKVGIGTTAPTALLEVRGDSQPLAMFSGSSYTIEFDHAGQEKFDISHGSSGLFFRKSNTTLAGVSQDHDFAVFNNSGDRYVNFDGSQTKVRIGALCGNSAPSATLHLSGSGDTNLLVEGHITASGNISASGGVSGSGVHVTGRVHANNVFAATGTSNFTAMNIGGGFGATGVTISSNGNFQLDGFINVDNDITASGNISSSITSTGSFGRVVVGGENNNSHHKLDVTGNVGISEDLHLRSNKKITWSHGDASIEEGTGVGSAFCLGFRTYDGSSNSLALLLEGDNGAKFTGNITASGNISASGNLILGGGITFDGDETINTIGASDDITINPDAKLKLGSAATDVIEIGRQSGTAGHVHIFANSSTVAGAFRTESISFNHPITASGNISASLTSTASFGRVDAIGVISADDLNVTDDLSVGGDSNIGTLLNFKQNNQAVMRVLGAGGGNVHGVDLIISGAQASSEGSARDGGDIILHAGLPASGNPGNVIINPHQGKVGIATSNPTKALQVEGDISASGDLIFKENSGIRFSDSDITHISMSGNDLFIRSDDDMIFKTDDDFIFRGGSSHNIGLFIDGDNQRVGIGGVSSPTKALQVEGDISASGTMFAHTGSFTHIPTINGITTFVAAGNLDIGPYNFRARTLQSDVSTGVVPISISSTTKCTNLNADLLDDQEGSHYLDFSNFVVDDDEISGDKIEGGTIGSVTITDLTATKLNVTHFTSSFITSSTIQTEGSNTFGDTIADQHTFNGHITASGNISSSGTNQTIGGLSITPTLMNYGLQTTGDNTVRFSTDGDSGDDILLQLYRNASAYGQVHYEPDGGTNSGLHITDFRDDTNSHIVFNTRGDNERMRIESDGKVGIGTTNPAKKLTVEGTTSSSVFSATGTNSADGEGGTGGYRFRNRADTGIYERNFSTAIMAPEYVVVSIDSNNNNNFSDGTPPSFCIIHDTGSLGHAPPDSHKLFEVKESGITTFQTASNIGVTINHLGGHITASGNISASGTSHTFGGDVTIGDDLTLPADGIINFGSDNAQIKSSTGALDLIHSQTNFESGIRLDTQGHIEFATVQNNNLDFATDTRMIISMSSADGTAKVGIGTISPGEALEVVGNISASATSTGSFGRIDVTGVLSADDLNVTDDLTVGDDLSVSGDSNIGTLLNFKQNNQAVIKVLGASGGNVHGVDLIISGASGNTEGSARDGGDIILHAGMKAAGNDGNVIINPNQGLMGIGTSNPTKELQVAGTISASGGIHTPAHYFTAGTADDYILYLSTTDSMEIKSQDINMNPGNGVGIGTGLATNNDSKLHVHGDMKVNSHITASANISASGNVIGNLYQPTFHNFVMSADTENYIPFPTSTTEATSTSYLREWIAPFDGSLSKIRFRGSTAARNTTFKLYVNAVIAGGATATSDTVNANVADTTFTFTFDETAAVYSAGDLLRVTIDPLIAPANVNVTMIWNYNTNTV